MSTLNTLKKTQQTNKFISESLQMTSECLDFGAHSWILHSLILQVPQNSPTERSATITFLHVYPAVPCKLFREPKHNS